LEGYIKKVEGERRDYFKEVFSFLTEVIGYIKDSLDKAYFLKLYVGRREEEEEGGRREEEGGRREEGGGRREEGGGR
jgi:hypothetical protein